MDKTKIVDQAGGMKQSYLRLRLYVIYLEMKEGLVFL